MPEIWHLGSLCPASVDLFLSDDDEVRNFALELVSLLEKAKNKSSFAGMSDSASCRQFPLCSWPVECYTTSKSSVCCCHYVSAICIDDLRNMIHGKGLYRPGTQFIGV